VLALSFASTALSLYLPLLSVDFFDRALIGKDVTTLVRVVLLFTLVSVLSFAANILIEIYAAESAVIRARQSRASGFASADLHEAAARVYTDGAAARVETSAKSALAAMADGDTLRTLLAALRRILKVSPVNAVALRRQLADEATAARGYILSS